MATIKENINQLEQTNAEMREVIGLCYAPLVDSEGMVDYPEKLARLAVDDATEQVISTAPRTTAGGLAIKDSIAVVGKIKGQTLVWNQYCKRTFDVNRAGLTFTDTNDGYLTINGTATSTASFIFVNAPNDIIGHNIAIPSGCLLGGSNDTYKMSFDTIKGIDIGTNGYCGKLNNKYFALFHAVGQVFNNVRMRKPLYFDLTRMFGSGQEPTTLDDFCLKIFGKSSADVTDADWEAISAYCEPTLLSSKPKKIVSKPADNSWTSEISVDPTTIVDADGNKVFPNGLQHIDEYKDEIDLERGVAIKRIANTPFPTSSNRLSASGDYYRFVIAFSGFAMNSHIKCAYYSPATNTDVWLHKQDKIIATSYSYNQLVVTDDSFTTKEDFNNYVSGKEFLYVLATPIEYPLPKRKCFYRVSNGGKEYITSDGIIPMVADIGYREAVTASEAVAMLADAAGI